MRATLAAQDDAPPGVGTGRLDPFVVEWDCSTQSPLADLARRHPTLSWAIRPLGFRWAVRCSGPVAAVAEIRDDTRWDPSKVLLSASGEVPLTFAYAPAASETSVLQRIAAGGGFILPPLQMRDGRLRVRFLSTSEAGAAPPAAWSARAALVSKRRLSPTKLRTELDRQIPSGPRLTPRQSEVLLEAVRAGYYEVPRRADVREVARRLSLGRSTAEEHLRAAESAVIRSAVHEISLPNPPEGPSQSHPATEHFAEFSTELDLYVELAMRGDRIAAVRLLRRMPARSDDRSHPLLHRIIEHIRTGTGDLRDLPVDLDVSPFERRVLEELRRIPPGQTRTYADIARRLGEPTAARAVGNACAHNPAVVVIPCHRVVPSRGGIGQYSAEGGPETKRRLLETERAAASAPTPTSKDRGKRV